MTIKQKIQNLFFPLGSVQTVKTGYLKGFRIRLTENSLWSPLLGKWEPAMQKIMVNVVKPGQVVYDLGANNGLHGLLMAGVVGAQGMVYNFEPLPDNIAEIDENFGFNNVTNYRNVPAAVADKVGVDHFVVAGHHKQGFIADGNKKGETTVQVTITTLDQFIKDGNPGPAFMKIDIEGAEGPALYGFSEFFGKYNPIMIIELHSPEQDKMVGRFLKEHGYKAFRFDPFAKLSFTEIKDLTKTYPEPDGIWGSILCLPPGKELSDYSFEK